MSTIDVKDAAGLTVPIEKPLAPARAAAALSRPVVLSTEDKASLDAILTALVLAAGSAIIGKVGIDQTTPGTTNKVFLTDISDAEYETVAASQTDQAMGATGATGDYLAGVLIVPGTTAAGAVSIKDGSGSSISIFAGGLTTALTTLIPFFVPLGIKSTSGAWKVTTGANVTAIGVGNFT